MSDEREVRKETNFWGKEKEVIYENNERVGEVKTEKRGGFLGLGSETVKVEYDTNGNQTGHTKNEDRGGIFGIGSEEVQVRYDKSGNEVGHSKVEKRGGLFGIGSHYERVEYDNDGREISQTHSERRGGFLGVGGDRRRVTRYTNTKPSKPSAIGSESASSFFRVVLGTGMLVVLMLAFFGPSGPEPEEKAPVSRFSYSLLSGGLVKELTHGVTLTRNLVAAYTNHAEANQLCSSLSHMGHTDWRLPSRRDMLLFTDAPSVLGLTPSEFLAGPKNCRGHASATFIWLEGTIGSGEYADANALHCPTGRSVSHPSYMNAAVICARED